MLQHREYPIAFPLSLETFFKPNVAATLRKVSSIPILAPLDFDYDCLYIKSVEELFTELAKKKTEQSGILSNLIETIHHCLTNNKPIHLDLQSLSLSQFDCQLRQHLPTIGTCDDLLSTMNAHKVNDFQYFLYICTQRNLATIKMGGIYGKACVWTSSMKLARDIYALKDGDYHPNVRVLSHKTNFTIPFQKAIIDPKITEGYYHSFNNPEKRKWHKFPGTVNMSPNLAFKKSLALNPKQCGQLDINEFLSFITEEQQHASPEDSMFKKEASLILT